MRTAAQLVKQIQARYGATEKDLCVILKAPPQRVRGILSGESNLGLEIFQRLLEAYNLDLEIRANPPYSVEHEQHLSLLTRPVRKRIRRQCDALLADVKG